MAQSLGIIKVFFGGVELPIKPGGSFKLGGVVSMPQVVGGGVDRSESMQASEITVKRALRRGQRLADLVPGNTERELQVQCDTGQTFVWESAFRSNTLGVTSGDSSEVDVTFAAGTPVEI